MHKKFFFYKINKLRKKIKEIKKIINTEQEIVHYKIFNKITISNINFLKGKNINIIKGLNFDDLNTSIKQFLLFRFISTREVVGRVIFSISSKKRIYLPIPSELFKFFEDEDVKINKFLSKINFLYLCLKEIVKSYCVIFKIILEQNNCRNTDHIQICDNQLFHEFPEHQKPKDLISWLIHNYKKTNFSTIYCNHDFKKFYRGDILIIGKNNFLPQLALSQKIIFFLWSNLFLLKSFFYLLLNNWIFALMSYEIILAKKVSFSKKIASDYFFSNSNAYYKPLWTDVIEKKGSNVVLFFYSSSFLGFKKSNRYLPNETALEIYRWKNIITWSENFQNFLKEQVFDKKINYQLFDEPIDMIDFNDTNLDDISSKKIISIFDIPPRRESIRLLYMPGSDYRSEINGINFLKHILSLSVDRNFHFVIKSKRLMNKEYSKKYKFFIKQIENFPNVIYLNPKVSSSRLISSSMATISIPWTSTAFISEYYNIPTIFYDCTSTLDKTDRGRQNIKLVKGLENLNSWFDELKKQFK